MSKSIDARIPSSSTISALFEGTVYAGGRKAKKAKDQDSGKDASAPKAKEAFAKVTQGSPMGHEFIDRRIIRISTPITDEVAQEVISQMSMLEAINPGKDIELHINSPGGSVTAGLAIYDKMKDIRCDVKTVCEGQAASMAAVLLCAGTPGKRFAMPNSTIMVHGPSAGMEGTAIDMKIQMNEIERLRDRMVEIMSDWTGLTKERVVQMMERDHFMSPEKAKANGLIDAIVEPRHKPPTHKSDAEKAFDALPPFTPGPGTGPNDQPVIH